MTLTTDNLATFTPAQVAAAVRAYLNTDSQLSSPLACARPLPNCPASRKPLYRFAARIAARKRGAGEGK